MKHSRKITTLIALTASLTLVLSGCSLGQTETPTTPETNAGTGGKISLNETPNVTELTFQIDESKLPAGYTISDTGFGGTEDDAPEDVNTNLNALTKASIKTPNDSCNLGISVMYGASYQNTWGDNFITNQTIWNSIGGFSSHDIQRKVTEIPYTSEGITGTVEVVTANWTVDPDEISPQMTVAVSARTFDVLQPTGYDPAEALKEAQKYNPNVDPRFYSSEGPYGSDATKGLPGIQVYYNCMGDATIDMDAFDKVIQSITLQGVTKKS